MHTVEDNNANLYRLDGKNWLQRLKVTHYNINDMSTYNKKKRMSRHALGARIFKVSRIPTSTMQVLPRD